MGFTEDQQFVDDNAKLLEVFIDRYLMDMGVQVHLSVQAINIHGQAGVKLVDRAAEDLSEDPNRDESEQTPTLRAVGCAPSLFFLHSLTSGIDTSVLPPAVVPSSELVEAALRLFHAVIVESTPA